MLRREQHGREAWEGAGPAGMRCLSIHMRAGLLNVNLPEAEKIENNNPLVDHSFGLMLLFVGRWLGGTKPGRVDKALSAYQNEIAQTNYLSPVTVYSDAWSLRERWWPGKRPVLQAVLGASLNESLVTHQGGSPVLQAVQGSFHCRPHACRQQSHCSTRLSDMLQPSKGHSLVEQTSLLTIRLTRELSATCTVVA